MLSLNISSFSESEELIMAVTYRRLFHLLIDKDMSVSDLQKKAGYSANISTKLKNDSYVSLETIEKICRALHCDIEDIVELKENRK
ncbi:hypothetical protein HMPREF3224_02326 [Anaerococcus hydrogenalis]|nr:hypothetical protein HMPREF3224_02326 [Anaerococcus hydrogenalis]